MVENYGDDPSAWRWGELHQANFRATPLGQGVDPQLDPMLDSLFNVHVDTSGGSAIVNATGWNAAQGFELTSLPSMRQITIVGDWDASLRVNTVGQSGRPDSRHYKDQVDMWRHIQYHPEWFSREAVEADAEATWELVPAG
jgi:penicillin amidase